MNDEPMPKLPDNRRFRIRRREDLVASAVGASLRTEGRVITEPYRPEEGIGRSPDWMLTLDGEPVALEVTRLLPPADVQKAQHLMVRIETIARDLLAPIVARMDGQVLVNLAYSTYDVAGLGGARLTAAASQLADDVRTALGSAEPGIDNGITLASTLPWVVDCEVTLLLGPHKGFYIIQAPDATQQPDLDAFVTRTIAKKGDQHVGHADRAILAVDAMFPDAEDLRDAFARTSADVPWWRVYLVHGSEATLVWTANG